MLLSVTKEASRRARSSEFCQSANGGSTSKTTGRSSADILTMPEGFLVGFKVALQDGRSVWVTQDALDLKGEGSTFLADWHDWPEVARLQEATQEAIDLIRSKFGASGGRRP